MAFVGALRTYGAPVPLTWVLGSRQTAEPALANAMEYQKDRQLSNAEVQLFFEELAPALVGCPIQDAIAKIGPFNAYADNDRGRIWYEWRSDRKTLVLETQSGNITRIDLELQPS